MKSIYLSVVLWLYYTICSFIALTMQLTVAGYATVGGIALFLPPLLLGCVLTFESGPAAAIYAVLLGTWCDMYMQSAALFTLFYPAAAVLIMRLSRSFAEPTILAALLWSFTIGLAGQLLYFGFMVWLPGLGGLPSFWPAVPCETLLSLCALPIVYGLFKLVNRRLRKV